MTHRRTAAVLAAIAIPIMFALAGCGHMHAPPHPNPTASADLTAGKHIASEVFTVCITQMGGTPPQISKGAVLTEVQVVSAIAQPAVMNNLAHLSGIITAYHCFTAHIASHAQRVGVLNCFRNGILTAVDLLKTSAGRTKVAQGVFNCSAGVLAQ